MNKETLKARIVRSELVEDPAELDKLIQQQLKLYGAGPLHTPKNVIVFWYKLKDIKEMKYEDIIVGNFKA